MAELNGIRVYVPLYDRWGNSVGQIELEPRVVEQLPEKGSRVGELVFCRQDNKVYFWSGSEWKAAGLGPHTHSRSDITDFWDSPFWSKIPDKPSQFPPESHTHPRSDITDFFSAPFWQNIPDRVEFYSTTDDLSDVVIHSFSWTEIGGGGSETLFDIAGETKLLWGIAFGDYGLSVKYTIDGASSVSHGFFVFADRSGDRTEIALIVPIHAESSLKVEIANTDSTSHYYAAGAITKCPFLDEKNPNVLFDVDAKTGEIRVIHAARRLIDKSGYRPPENCKHVHLVGEYELSQLPRGVPLKYIRYRRGKFERAKWGYVFRKEVSVLGKRLVLWERTLEFDRELSKEEIVEIEAQLGAKLVRVV